MIDWFRLTETPYVQVPDEDLHRYASSGDSQAEQATHWIEVAAYYLWLEDGCPDGRDVEHWQKAYQLFLDRQDNQ